MMKPTNTCPFHWKTIRTTPTHWQRFAQDLRDNPMGVPLLVPSRRDIADDDILERLDRRISDLDKAYFGVMAPCIDQPLRLQLLTTYQPVKFHVNYQPISEKEVRMSYDVEINFVRHNVYACQMQKPEWMHISLRKR